MAAMRSACVVAFLWAVPLSALALDPSRTGEVRAQAMGLCFEPRVILETVARRMNIPLRPEIPVPAIFLESATPLRRFQDAIGTQWGFRPEVFANTYAVAHNEIYLRDDAAYHLVHNRTLDDALAHEFVHYLQARYLNEDLASEWREAEAVAIQSWFRREYPRCLPHYHRDPGPAAVFQQ